MNRLNELYDLYDNDCSSILESSQDKLPLMKQKEPQEEPRRGIPLPGIDAPSAAQLRL